MVKVQIKKVDPKVQIPKYKTDGSSGVDLMAFLKETKIVMPGESILIPTGLSLAVPKDLEVQIRPRSGLAAKYNISVLNAPGTVDSDYRGEIKIIIYNHGNKKFEIKNGDRVAQMILTPVLKFDFEEVKELSTTIRGSGGFGSTGR